MDNKITFDTLPSAVMELTKKVDLLISMFSTKIEKLARFRMDLGRIM